MKKLLLFKHWQLFLLLFVLPLCLHMGFMGYLFSRLFQEDLPLPADDPSAFMDFFATMMPIAFAVFAIIMLLQSGWQYTLGSSLNEKLPANVKMNLNLFRVFMAFPFVYMVLLVFFVTNLFSDIAANEVPNFYWFFAIFPMHLFTMFCLFYGIYFNAKSLKAAELQRPVVFNDYVAEFFLLWFYPVGIWILQPRINTLFRENDNDLSRY